MTSSERKAILELCGVAEVVAAVSPSPHVVELMRQCDRLKARISKKLAIPKPLPFVPTKKHRAAKKAKTKRKTASVKAQIMKRAKGECEYANVRPGKPCSGELQHDHFFGGKDRIPRESVETGWALCHWHHHLKTLNVPDKAHWDAAFYDHCGIKGIPHPPELEPQNRRGT